MFKNIAIAALLLLLLFGGFKAYQYWKRGEDLDLYAKQLQEVRVKQQARIAELNRQDSIKSAAYKLTRDSLQAKTKESNSYRRKLIAEQNKPVPKYTNDQLDSAFADIPKPINADTLDYLITQWRAQFLALMRKNFGLALITIDKQQETIEAGQEALKAADETIAVKDQRIAATDSLVTTVSAERDNEKDKVANEKKKVTLWKIVTGAVVIIGTVLLGLVAAGG